MALSSAELERYSRHLILEGFGLDAQLKLKNASVLVVGSGGLGCPCLLYLTAAGVGHIGIADQDVVSLSNLQRQILFDTDDIGKFKCEIAKEKLLKKNDCIRITAHPARIVKENALEIIKEYDLVIDGTDNFATSYLLNDACIILNKPFVYGSLFQFEGQVTTFNYKDGPTLRCLFPEPPAEDETTTCAQAGVMGVLPGLIGTWQATEAIKIITEIGNTLSGDLALFNALTNEINKFKFNRVDANKQIKQLGNYESDYLTTSDEIDAQTLKKWQNEDSIQLIDVREDYEYDDFNIGGINLPLQLLDKRLNEINPDKITVVICQSGIRSRKGIEIIKNHISAIKIFHLKGGLNTYN